MDKKRKILLQCKRIFEWYKCFIRKVIDKMKLVIRCYINYFRKILKEK